MRIIGTLAIVLALTACKSDSTTEPVFGDGSFTARVDGQSWSANFVESQYIGDVFAISGSDGSMNLLLTVAATGTGTYDLTAGSAAASVAEGGKAWFVTGQGGSGSLTITSLDSKGAKGTFAFTVGGLPNSGTTGTRTVTQGSFDVKF